MDRKTQIMIGLFVGLGSGIALFIFDVVFELFPSNKYVGVAWMCFIPMAIYYATEKPQMKNLLNMWLTFICGLIWGWLSVITTPIVKGLAGVWGFALVEFGILIFLVLFVHKGLLGNTPLNSIPCAFMGIALSVATSTTSWWSGRLDLETFQLIPIEGHWNQLDLFIIFTVGIIATLFVDALCGLFVGNYIKKKSSK